MTYVQYADQQCCDKKDVSSIFSFKIEGRNWVEHTNTKVRTLTNQKCIQFSIFMHSHSKTTLLLERMPSK